MKTFRRFFSAISCCALTLALALALTSTALAQYSPTTLYIFPSDNVAGAMFPSGLIMDGAGNLYGTTITGGTLAGYTGAEATVTGRSAGRDALRNHSMKILNRERQDKGKNPSSYSTTSRA